MTRRKPKLVTSEVEEEDNVADTYNDIDEIGTVSGTVPEPTEVNNYDVAQ